MAFINEAMVLFLSPFLVGLFLLRSALSLKLEITALEGDAVVQEERIVFSANIANRVAGIERAALRNDK